LGWGRVEGGEGDSVGGEGLDNGAVVVFNEHVVFRDGGGGGGRIGLVVASRAKIILGDALDVAEGDSVGGVGELLLFALLDPMKDSVGVGPGCVVCRKWGGIWEGEEVKG
jgi:hypothetical protein